MGGLIFAGTPEFAERALHALIEAGHDIRLVLTRPDKPAGRGQHLQTSPVKKRALTAGLRVAQPASLHDAQAQALIAEVGADVMVVAAYGLILPKAVLTLPVRGCLNIHASLLPRWRGAAPIQRAIEAGDTETGITIMQMDEGLDTGPMLLGQALAIGPTETGGSLHDRLAQLGAELIVRALSELDAGRLVARPQPLEGVTYAHKIDKAQSQLDWRGHARSLANRIRAFDPFPGCLAQLERASATPLKIWRAELVEPPAAGSEAPSAPGQVLAVDASGITVACGQGILRLTELQKPGGRRLAAADFLRGSAIGPSDRFVPAPS